MTEVKLKSMMTVTGLTLFALIASPTSLVGTKAEINADADKALDASFALVKQGSGMPDDTGANVKAAYRTWL